MTSKAFTELVHCNVTTLCMCILDKMSHTSRCLHRGRSISLCSHLFHTHTCLADSLYKYNKPFHPSRHIYFPHLVHNQGKSHLHIHHISSLYHSPRNRYHSSDHIFYLEYSQCSNLSHNLGNTPTSHFLQLFDILRKRFPNNCCRCDSATRNIGHGDLHHDLSIRRNCPFHSTIRGISNIYFRVVTKPNCRKFLTAL